MRKKPDQTAPAAELRRDAEKRLRQKQKSEMSKAGDQRTAKDTARLVHELQVHQIELEMQNEELQQARAQMEALVARYTDLYDSAPAGYMTLDREGAIRQVNLTGAVLLGIESSQLVNRRLALFVAEDDRRTFSDFLQRVFASQAKESCEVTLPREGLQPLVVQIEGTRSADAQECRAVALDITERKRAEGELHQSERKYRLLVESLPQRVFLKDRQSVYVSCNENYARGLRIASDDIAGKTDDDFYRHELAEKYRADDRRVMTTGVSETLEELYIQEGKEFWVHTVKAPVHNEDGECVGVLGIFWDVTERRRTENTLKLFRSLVDRSSDAIEVLDPATGQFLDVNERGCLDLGYSREEFLALRVFDIDPTVNPLAFQKVGEELRKSGVLMWQGLHRRKDGSTFPVEVNLKYVQLDRDYMIAAVRDITERIRSAEAREEEARITAAMTQVGQTLMAELGSPTLMNSLCQVSAEVLGCDLSHTLLWQEDEQVFRPIAGFGNTPEEKQAEQVISIPCSLLQPLLSRLDQDDVVQEFSPAISRLRAATQLCMALRHGRDLIGIQVVSRRGDDRSFGTTEERIARRIAQLASLALNHVQVREDLERSSRLKSDFVATMSHELRSPLNIIMGYTDLLLAGDFGPLSLEALDPLARVAKNAQELLSLIEATLDIGRLDKEQVPLDLQPVCLADVVGEIACELEPKAEVVVICDVSPDLSLRTDPVKLKVILRNVIANAFKFTETGTVTVTARASHVGVEITVSDTGVGIAAQVLPVIFDSFRQGDPSTTRRFGGTGLGLYIVRRLLSILAGTITVESELGCGSTFRVWIPDAGIDAGI